MDELCVEFKNEKGNTLRGILHPGSTDKYQKVSLVFLNTGLNDMVGWHRLQLKVARHFALQGYNVMRFDNFGMGLLFAVCKAPTIFQFLFGGGLQAFFFVLKPQFFLCIGGSHFIVFI